MTDLNMDVVETTDAAGRPRQAWLLPYQNPLGSRFTREFFAAIPREPGVYLMFNASGDLLYVGKAKDLRARLLSYRRARPGDVSRKVIRLLNAIREIRWEICSGESEALLRENHLLRELKPPFNVVNTRPESYVFIGLAVIAERQGREREPELPFAIEQGAGTWLKLRVETSRDELRKMGFQVFGAYKGAHSVRRGLQALARLIWAGEPGREISGLGFAYPTALIAEKAPAELTVALPSRLGVIQEKKWVRLLQRYFRGTSMSILSLVSERLLEHAGGEEGIPPFVCRLVQEDLDRAKELYEHGPRRNRRLLKFQAESKPETRGETLIAQDKIDDLIVLYRHSKS